MKTQSKVFCVLAVIASTIFLSEATAKETFTAKQCIRGLLKAQQLIDDRNLKISKRYLRGRVGSVMMRNKFGLDVLTPTRTDKLEDIQACFEIELWSVASHTIIMNALNGFYETSGKNLLAECFAATTITENFAKRLFGDAVGRKVGVELGKPLGTAISLMGYLFTEHPYNLSEITSNSNENFLRLSKIENNFEGNKSTLSLMHSCSKIGIDANYMVRILSIAGQDGLRSSR